MLFVRVCRGNVEWDKAFPFSNLFVIFVSHVVWLVVAASDLAGARRTYSVLTLEKLKNKENTL